ncbi:hypothetical protein [Streptomyces sp. NPDC006551]|uniref:hypothetical protein n=1 Tax=Streptomyces sp. NPDC006551 TaxID=3157178 RepID=UPI0033BF9FD4
MSARCGPPGPFPYPPPDRSGCRRPDRDAAAGVAGVLGERVQPHPPVRLYGVEAGDGHRATVAALGSECRVVRHDGDGVLRRPRPLPG